MVSLPIVTLLWLATTLLSHYAATPVDRAVSPAPTVPAECAMSLARQLAQADASAQVLLDGRIGLVEVTLGEDALPSDSTADDAAQVIWTVFDGAIRLPASCLPERLQVTIHADRATLRASVDCGLLRGWGEGQLSDQDLIDGVVYLRESASPHQP